MSLILAVTLAFVAIFIDYSRISALKAKTERLVHAATRSVMSAYVPELQRSYGLFAYGETDPSLIFTGVLERSLIYKERSDVLPITDAKLVSSSVELSRELGSYEVFKTQINEEMKYKAPVNFALEVVGRFKPMSQTMKEASGAVEILEKLQKLYDKREAELDKMVDLIKKAGQRTDDLKRNIGSSSSGQISDIQDVPLSGHVANATDMAAQYDDYKFQKERFSADDTPPDSTAVTDTEESNPGFFESIRMSMRIADYESGSQSVTSRMNTIVSRAFPPHSRDLTQAKEHLKKAQELNTQIEQVIAAIGDRSADAAYDQVSGSDIPGADGGPSGSPKSVQENLEQLVLKPTFFGSMNTHMQHQETDFISMKSKVDALEGILPQAFSELGLSTYTLKSYVASAGQVTSFYHERYGSGGRTIQVIENQLAEHRKHDEERKQLEKDAKNQLQQANELIEFLSKSKGHIEDFQKVESYFQENVSLNASRVEASKADKLEQDAAAVSKDSMQKMDGFFGGMSSMLDATGDRLLQNEYASDHFSNFDLSKIEALAKPGAKIDGAVAAELLSIKEQELEYILYGFGDPGANLAAAYGEIFAMRVAIRTMEALVDPKILALGNPLVILAKAVLEGLIVAVADMAKLATQGHVELAKTIPIKLTYKDHLRLFLFAHPGNDNRLSRMLALIRFDTGVNPDDHYTYLSGEAAISMPIWFLPGVMHSLNIGGDSGVGSEYTVDIQADYSY
ncbi:DUF5702 domain-containing protein [Saccharibacillus sp. JS10]|uniref:DUF5702 domain-containing protein n=1 Tax=Saccharibacillus sp. JS10 TaxID=2950552 RepID=UPI00210D1F42|nr:DUF5702 domain-containing protein [Saccharibacillus sp. JS10]MCQ4086756.1 DUF5702 domain-containing protein [Saccharibacillus sp. JS10]